MRVLYYDCFSGISGDMNLGALIDLGVPSEYLINELRKLNISDEFHMHINKEVKQGIAGTKVSVYLNNIEHHHGHSHNHNHHSHGRNYSEIKELILQSDLKKSVKEVSLKIFDEVAVAEAKVHNKHIEEVHFHEVGATDSIVDIIGASICLDYLEVDMILSSPVEVGYGTLKCDHGILPVPAPATAEILMGVPIIAKNVPFEATTPTGAAILKATVSKFTREKDFNINKIGYGLGHKDGVGMPNVLRVLLSEEVNKNEKEYVVECNMDDMRGEEFELLMERLFENGAFDVFYTPIYMKKQRPATKLSVICGESILAKIKETIFLNSSTIGIRKYEVTREKLDRKEKIISCKFGDIPVKVSYYNNEKINVKPEYDKCKEVAKREHISIKDVFNEVMKNYY